jgi:hypothetical protein
MHDMMVHCVLFFFIHFRAPSSTEIHVARSLRNVVIGGQCTVVRAARALSPKPRFSYLDLCCLDARTLMLSLISFRYFILYLNTSSYHFEQYSNS